MHIDRHLAPPTQPLVYVCFNVYSSAKKKDYLLDVCRTQLIDVLFLTETWHDANYWLRADRFQVVDRPQPRLCTDTLMTYHGGIVVYVCQ